MTQAGRLRVTFESRWVKILLGSLLTPGPRFADATLSRYCFLLLNQKNYAEALCDWVVKSFLEGWREAGRRARGLGRQLPKQWESVVTLSLRQWNVLLRYSLAFSGRLPSLRTLSELKRARTDSCFMSEHDGWGQVRCKMDMMRTGGTISDSCIHHPLVSMPLVPRMSFLPHALHRAVWIIRGPLSLGQQSAWHVVTLYRQYHSLSIPMLDLTSGECSIMWKFVKCPRCRFTSIGIHTHMIDHLSTICWH